MNHNQPRGTFMSTTPLKGPARPWFTKPLLNHRGVPTRGDPTAAAEAVGTRLCGSDERIASREELAGEAWGCLARIGFLCQGLKLSSIYGVWSY